MLSRTSLQAIKALVELGRLPPGACAGAKAIAKIIQAPQNYLGKLLQGLASEGVLVSRKGQGGGFRLNKDPSKISLYQIIQPIDHVERWEGCFLGGDRCSAKSPCQVHFKWETVREKYLEFLKTTTIADLIHKG